MNYIYIVVSNSGVESQHSGMKAAIDAAKALAESNAGKAFVVFEYKTAFMARVTVEEMRI